MVLSQLKSLELYSFTRQTAELQFNFSLLASELVVFSHEIAQTPVSTHVPLESFAGFILQLLAFAENTDAPFEALLRPLLRSLESIKMQFARFIRVVLIEEHHAVQRVFVSIAPVNFERMHNQITTSQSTLSRPRCNIYTVYFVF